MTQPSSKRQEQHYEEIGSMYADHYYDETSMGYRRKFLYDPLFADLDLNGLAVADLACGHGVTSLEIKERFPGAKTAGYDISNSACQKYQEIVGEPAYHCDLTSSHFKAHKQYDVVIIIGGLHHCVSDLPQALRNIRHMLKPGGYFLAMEPNSAFALEFIRKFWYRLDKFFDQETERAISINEVQIVVTKYMKLNMLKYVGGPAYFLLLNSLIFRVPLRLKKYLSRPLTILEHVYALLPLPARWLHPIFLVRYVNVIKN